MTRVAIFYHCLFVLETPDNFLPGAFEVIPEQMEMLANSGLLGVTSEFLVGVNGGNESEAFVQEWIPSRAQVRYHGLQCRTENRTIRMLEEWLPSHPDYNVLYFHSKGATNNYKPSWRNCMMRNLVMNWRRCLGDLTHGYDSVGCHWLESQGVDCSQNIWGGNFWWATTKYLLTLPSILARHQIKASGLDALASRYEAEVWIGNGPALPRIKDYHPMHPLSHV